MVDYLYQINKEYQNIIDIIESSNNNFQNIFPQKENILKSLSFFKNEETKVVIIGQDPYHTKDMATGLAFGTNSKKIPPSLKNIKNELKCDLNIELQDYTLEKWAKQGVLLLNSSLTVIEGKPGSHLKLWNKFTDNIISEINKLDKVIFVAWGAFAHKKLKNIDCKKHKIIISSHPSPLSFQKNYNQFPMFKGSKPFSKINQYLLEYNKKPIEW